MGAFTSVTILGAGRGVGSKTLHVSALGPASYDAGGSVLDLSVATLGPDGLTNVRDCHLGGIAAASTKYQCVYVPGASAALGKIKIHDSSQAADAEASGDLSAVTFYFTINGQ